MHEQPPCSIILHWSEEPGVSSGQGHDLLRVQGFGTSYEEALVAALEAIRWW